MDPIDSKRITFKIYLGGNYERSLLSSFVMNPSFGVLPLFQQDVNPSLEAPREKDFELAVLLAFSLKNAMKYPGGWGLSVVLSGVLF